MRPAKAFLALSVLTSFLIAAPPAFSGIEIVMKNGREIYAEECRQEDTRLKCFKSDGIFYIDEKDIAGVRKTSGDHTEYAPMGQSPLLKDNKDNGTSGGKPAPGSRIEEINRRKKELMSERKLLLKERQMLKDDIKKSPDWMPVKQFEELEKRNAEIERKIEEFNEEVTRLDAEEKGAGEDSKSQNK